MEQISFIINTSVNTLQHVKLLLRSLKENLKSDQHEILIFIDSDNENTFDYLKSIQKDYVDLRIIRHKLNPCVGYSRNNNILVENAKYDIISYLQSDMVVCENYDELILQELEPNCILSSTRIEPPLHGQSPTTITKDFGLEPEDFNMTEFVEFSNSVKSDKELSYFFAPITFYKKVWKNLGGYDTMFRRSREDSDFLIRALKSGVKVKQTFKANVYHFTCVSSRGKKWYDRENADAQKRLQIQNMADKVELTRFIRKWGNFSHGEFDLVKYDIDFVYPFSIKSEQEVILLRSIEPYVSRVWVTNNEDRDALLVTHRNEHEPANFLLNFSKEDWENNKQFYNQINLDEIYKVGEPTDYNIKITSKNGIDNESNLHGIHQSISMVDVGTYEFGGFVMIVDQKIDISKQNLKVENPKFEDSLLIIN